MADRAFLAADREPADRRAATSLAERLVEGPLARRANVLDRTRLGRLTPARLDGSFPAASGHDVGVALDGRTVLERGDPTGGATVRRAVLVASDRTRTVRPRLRGNATTVPNRTDRLRVDVRPPPNATVRTVRADGRVLLHDPDGLEGGYRVNVSRDRRVRLAFDTNVSLTQGDIALRYRTTTTEPRTLAVTVDA
jgi:hypothetical protein